MDEAIKHAKEKATEKYNEAMLCHANPDDGELDGCIECAREHEQLAECPLVGADRIRRQRSCRDSPQTSQCRSLCSQDSHRPRGSHQVHGPAHWPQVSSIWTLRPAFSPSWAVFSLQASSCCLQVPAYSGQLGRFWRKRLCFRFNSIKFGLQPHRFVFPICAAVFV